MPKEFNITGKLSIYVDFNIEADTEAEARRKAKTKLEDTYRLDNKGVLHNSEHGVEHKWDVYDDDPEYEDNEEEN
jgi:predicted Ser/Thr protein kinase